MVQFNLNIFIKNNSTLIIGSYFSFLNFGDFVRVFFPLSNVELFRSTGMVGMYIN